MTTAFMDELRQLSLLEPEQLEEVERSLHARFPEPKALARELLQRDWLTPYQANLLLQGRGRGLVLGSYVLLEKLGEGGMGAVFKARHQMLGRIVALKLVRQERLDNPNAVRRFRREIKAAAQLNHPNVVLAFDADQAGDAHFFTMEIVEGTDLSRLVKEKGPLSIEQACDYIRQAAQGLQAAFERGLVHRDIKPHNLLLANGVVKVLDLGLARVASEADMSESSGTLTHEGAVMGTPDYIAPEQALESHTVDIRADLYALGCTLYFLLTGRVPFPGGNLAEKLLKHQLAEPVPVETLRPGVPEEVAAVVRKLMAKKPADRFQTPAELAAELARRTRGGHWASDGMTTDRTFAATPQVAMHVTPEPFTQTLPEIRRRKRTEAEKHRWLLLNAGGGGILLALLAVLAFLLLRSSEKSRPTALAEGGSSLAADFVALFNGKDLTGWKTHPDNESQWTVHNGVMVTGGRKGYLFTERSNWRNFHLRAEMRLNPGGNSGLFLRCNFRSEPGAGYEVQLANTSEQGNGGLTRQRR
jgi:serine/threonine protein kinase